MVSTEPETAALLAEIRDASREVQESMERMRPYFQQGMDSHGPLPVRIELAPDGAIARISFVFSNLAGLAKFLTEATRLLSKILGWVGIGIDVGGGALTVWQVFETIHAPDPPTPMCGTWPRPPR